MKIKWYKYNPYNDIIDILIIFMSAICILILLCIPFRDKKEDVNLKRL